ncbi:MAG TPA: sulfatase-like hydrolase/transferase, partial [Thermoanaerobaculia bacterium]|nr:sulfatase-like hydrolase/transferase [Thermoanaerobaculia bacterium]
LVASCKREQPAPNVLLITLDTFRADRLGKGATPTLDALAANGVRFQNAMSSVPLTLPSHATILSGVLPPHHGVRNNGAGSFPADRATLATLLSQKGYRTAAFTGAFVLDHRFGLNRGFDLYDDEIPRDPNLGDHLEAERRGDVVADRALQWLSQQDARPFFAWVHLYDAHFPYTPPDPYRAKFASSPYDGEIAFVDAQVQRLLAFLDERKLRENTIIVIAGDHGEALGEHGELTHGLLLYEPTLRVPLVIAAPDVERNVVKTPVSLADLAPTIASLANAPFTTAVDGRDLSSALREHREPTSADLYAETEYPAVYGWSPLAAMRRGDFKYIAAPAPELYDVAKDPGETRNVLTDERRVMRALEAGVKAMRAQAVAAPASAPDAETMAKLASLGYVGGLPATRSDAARPDPKVMVPLFRKFEEATWATTDQRLDEAAAILEDLVKKDPPNPVFRGSLAKVERRRGRASHAIELYREAIAYAPDDPQSWYNLASAFQEAGDMKHAADAASEALRRDTKNADAHNVLGIAYSAQGDPARAMDEFQKAIAIDPRNARAYNNAGNVARAMRRDAEAEQAYQKALALAPTYADPLNGLGALEIDRNRPRVAVAYFDRALQLAPGSLDARLNRAVALQLAGDLAGAAREYRAFIERSANAPAYARQRQIAQAMVTRLESK